MATTATTTTYQYPYPLGGDSLSNVATRIKELADRSETVTAQIIAGNITLAPGTIYNASIAAAAAISYSKLDLTGAILSADLAGSIAPSKITGTAITAADTGTVTGTIIASSVALGGNPTTTTVTGTTDNTTKIATTGFVQQVATALTVGSIPDDSLTNVKINSAAAIAYSKLNLTNSVTSADIVSVTLNQIPSYQSYRNLFYNGAIQVAQRSTSTASITTSGYYTADRWQTSLSSLGTWTQSVENDAPSGSGFKKSLKMLCTTADASPASTDLCIIQQQLEGYDVQRLAKGTGSALTMTLSFWVKSNVTGTYVALIFDANNNRCVSKTYTINASATWEQKTVSIPADATGAFTNDANSSLVVRFCLGFGSAYTSGILQTSWGAYSDAVVGAGQTNLAAATSNYWQVTGVQLEAGSVATPFEFEPYETTLRKCLRYYYALSTSGDWNILGTGTCASTTEAFVLVPFPVPLRASPTFTSSALANFRFLTFVNAPTSFYMRYNAALTAANMSIACTGLTLGYGATLINAPTTTCSLFFSAEL